MRLSRSFIILLAGFSLLSLTPEVALATAVSTVNGNQVEIDVSNDFNVEENKLYYLINSEDIKLGIVRIETVTDGKAFGTLLKGTAQYGWTLKLRESKQAASKKSNTRRKPASDEGTAEGENTSSSPIKGLFIEPAIGYLSGTAAVNVTSSVPGASAVNTATRCQGFCTGRVSATPSPTFTAPSTTAWAP